MTVLSVWLPEEIAVTPESIVPDAQIPLLPASRIGSGVFHPDRIPQFDASKLSTGVLADERISESFPRVTEVETFVSQSIATHEQATDPHPQYVRSEDLIFHANSAGNGYHIPPTGITNNEVDPDAAIAWSKISKTGSVASDIGASATDHTHAALPIVSTTAPSSPVVNTRWLDTSDNQTWFWNGTYWLSEQRYWLTSTFGNLSITASGGSLPVNAGYNLWIETLRFSGRFLAGTYDASNNWSIRLIRESSTVTTVDTSLPLPNQVLAANEYQVHSLSVNLHRAISALGIVTVRNDALKTGSPPNINNAAAILFYRLAKV